MTGTIRQHEAISSHNTSVIVSAGAGTGKTYVLVQKYLDLLKTFGAENPDKNSRISVQNILALTFTDKAAAEMKERIRNEMDKKDGNFWERSRLEFLLAPVQTFHSFCASVLREFAFEAGLEPSFIVLDQQEASRILSLSLKKLIHTPNEGENVKALISTLSIIGEKNLEEMIRYLYVRSEDAETFFSHLKKDPETVIARWQDEIRLFKEREVTNIKNNPAFSGMVTSLLAYALMDVPGDDKAMIYLQKVKPYLELLIAPGTPEDFLDVALLFTKEQLRGGIKDNWSEDILSELKAENKNLKEWLKKNTHAIAGLSFDKESDYSHLTLRFISDLEKTFRLFCEIVREEKLKSGGLDFSDLIKYTRKLFLEKHDLVASYYRSRYRFILIDEFQDTDPVQYEIVSTIVGDPSPAVNSLFIVGDPKQSIYLFREADVSRFKDAREFITSSCIGKNISLDICFRSSPPVVSFVNTLFSHLFNSADKPWEFTYDPITVSDERSDHKGTITLLLAREDSEPDEYEAISGHIKKIIEEKTEVYEEGVRDENGKRTFSLRPADYGDITILVERRTHLGRLIHALACRNIPYYVHKGTGFYNRQEILDLISLLSFLYRPYDDIHLVGLLRSPYFGFSDLMILKISREKGTCFFDKLEKFGQHDIEIAKVHTLLSTWQKNSGRVRIVTLIQSVLIESGVLSVYGGLVEGDQILSNIDKLLEIIRIREDIGSYHLTSLVTDLSDALDREEEEGEAMIDDPNMNAVRIMTVHASKGLEYPICIIAEMSAAPNLKQGPILLDSKRDLLGLVLPDPDQDLQPSKTPIYSLLKKEFNDRLLEEKKRLLYVALTRAADHLIMSGTRGEELPDETKKTRLGWICSALGINEQNIREGYAQIKTEDGSELKIHIITPPRDLSPKISRTSPFEISIELEDCHGLFQKTCPDSDGNDNQPFQVTALTQKLDRDFKYHHGDEGGGTSFGTAIHEVLRGKDPASVVREYGIVTENRKNQIHSVYEEFWNHFPESEITWKQNEMAFTVPIIGIFFTGRIDLVLKRKDGTFLVVDYKSEDIPAIELTKKRSYQLQVEIYRRVAKTLGMKSVRGALYSVFDNRLVELEPWDDDDFTRTIQSVTSGL
ncbi:MAG: UvrD-helicase domain-containing protein [Methanomicrobiales archaeon]|nr:UvrD-helicase domain-containing protein [Methanomicrobiales archaeon]